MAEDQSLTQGGNWKTDGETVVLQANPGETYVVMHWTKDPDNPDGPTYTRLAWLTAEAPQEISLKTTERLMVTRVTETSFWTGEIFAPCAIPTNCPFPPEPRPVWPPPKSLSK